MIAMISQWPSARQPRSPMAIRASARSSERWSTGANVLVWRRTGRNLIHTILRPDSNSRQPLAIEIEVDNPVAGSRDRGRLNLPGCVARFPPGQTLRLPLLVNLFNATPGVAQRQPGDELVNLALCLPSADGTFIEIRPQDPDDDGEDGHNDEPVARSEKCRATCFAGHLGNLASYSNDRVNRSSIAFLPLSWILRVPVPVKCGCVITGVSGLAAQSVPVQRNHPSFS